MTQGMNAKPTTLITGSGRRIGAAIGRHLAAQGHNLVLHYATSKAEAEALATELRGRGTAVTLVQADLANLESLAGFWKGLPPVTSIIHNASRYARDTLETMTLDDLRAHMAVNFEAPMLLTQGFMAQLPQEAAGNIIVLGDDALGWSVAPQFFSYAASKHSWRAVIELLGAAVAPRARANLVALAPTLPGESDPEGLFERLAERAPLKRTGDVVEVLAAIDYLSTACGVTGQVLGLGNGMGIAIHRA
jgi:NAD(P)-dependent dehydrogenase (short-subunit alcohol dehydrogenase family)